MVRINLDSAGSVLPSLVSALKTTLPAKNLLLLRKIVKEAEKQSLPLYLVGGFVRDLLLGRPSMDLDLVLEGDAIQFGRRLVRLFGGNLVPHKDFGTAVWWLAAGRKQPTPQLAFIDLISARSETYAQPAALPRVARAEISADQFRRDFTINTLALALNGLQSGRVLDPWGGVRDLNSRLIRVLHPLSFVDDPTRIFRGLRLAGRLEFRLETSTLRHLQAALPKLKLLSGERLRNELELVLAEPKRVEVLQSLQFFGALAQIDKHLRFFPKVAALLSKDSKPIPKIWGLDQVSPSQLGFVLWFMHLPAKSVDRIAASLRFEADLHAAVVGSSRLLAESDALRSMPASRLVPRLEQEPLLSTYALFLLVRGTPLGKKLEKFARDWRHVQPLADGNTLKKRGLRPGPAYTLILAQLRAARLDGKVRTAKQESALLEKLIYEHR